MIHTVRSCFLIMVVCLCASGLHPASSTCFAEDMLIGAVEDIILLPWYVKLPARIDTGAATTSLGVRNLKLTADSVEFNLPGHPEDQLIRLPVVNIKRIRSSSGHQRRPIVALTLCIGQQKLHIDVNLTNRAGMQFPLIIGRNVIQKGFIVDVRKTRVLLPHCPELQQP